MTAEVKLAVKAFHEKGRKPKPERTTTLAVTDTISQTKKELKQVEEELVQSAVTASAIAAPPKAPAAKAVKPGGLSIASGIPIVKPQPQPLPAPTLPAQPGLSAEAWKAGVIAEANVRKRKKTTTSSSSGKDSATKIQKQN